MTVTVEQRTDGYFAVVRCGCRRVYGFLPAAELTLTDLFEAARIGRSTCPCTPIPEETP